MTDTTIDEVKVKAFLEAQIKECDEFLKKDLEGSKLTDEQQLKMFEEMVKRPSYELFIEDALTYIEDEIHANYVGNQITLNSGKVYKLALIEDK